MNEENMFLDCLFDSAECTSERRSKFTRVCGACLRSPDKVMWEENK